jgi:hypothetical protein
MRGGQCCGSAGIYNLLRPDVASTTFVDKVREMEAMEVEEVIVSGPEASFSGTREHLRQGFRCGSGTSWINPLTRRARVRVRGPVGAKQDRCSVVSKALLRLGPA